MYLFRDPRSIGRFVSLPKKIQLLAVEAPNAKSIPIHYPCWHLEPKGKSSGKLTWRTGKSSCSTENTSSNALYLPLGKDLNWNPKISRLKVGIPKFTIGSSWPHSPLANMKGSNARPVDQRSACWSACCTYCNKSVVPLEPFIATKNIKKL